VIQGEGFVPKENLYYTSNSAEEVLQGSLDIDEIGKFRLFWMPAVIGKESGTDKINFTGQQCEAEVEFEWGLPAVNSKQ
jgi:hypothetical protein